MNRDIESIINDGVYAPSGENCQPWRFSIRENRISIFNIPEADQSLYNFKQKGSLTAHGALIENIVISANEKGYKAVVQLFPQSKEKNLISIIILEKNKEDRFKNDQLYKAISKRCTNRKDYSGQKLSVEQKKALVDAARIIFDTKLKVIDDDKSMQKLGAALAVNEQIVFENKSVHDFFYGHLLWKKTEQNKAGGFYIKTLEFLPHQLKGVKLFKNWLLLKVLNKVAGVSKMIVKENATKYANSGTSAVIVMDGDSDIDFVNAGRAIQRVWLTATNLGLAVHPCTGVLYFMERIKGGDRDAFSLPHQNAIQKAYESIASIFQTDNKVIPMLFRIGFADAPTAKAMRLKPQIIYEV